MIIVLEHSLTRILKRQEWSLADEISLADLPLFVTEQRNPGNQKGLLEARVELPAPFLRRALVQ